MSATFSLLGKLGLDARDFQRGAKDAQQSIGKVADDMDDLPNKSKASGSKAGSLLSGGLATGFAMAGGIAAITAGVGYAVDAASNLQESINAVNVSYGESATAVHKLGEDATESFGLSKRAFNDAAVSFTNFATDIAGNGGDVAGTLDDLMTRSTDFASVMNMDVTDAANAFKSALSGEAEPLKAFGINISDAAVNAYALREGIIAVGESMSDTEKVQARYGLLMEETSKVAGDFANTSDGYANSMKMAKAELENLAASFGKLLLPMMSEAVGTATDLLSAIQDLASLPPVQIVVELVKKTGINPFASFGDVADDFGAIWDKGIWGSEEVEQATESLNTHSGAVHYANEATAEYAKTLRGLIGPTVEEAEANRESVSAYKLVSESINDAIDAHTREQDAIKSANDARRTATDDIYAAADAEDAWWAQLQESTAALAVAETAVGSHAATTRDMATATDEAVTAQLTAAGVNVDSVAGQDAWTEAMLRTAEGLSGPVREEVLNYISLVSGIPAEKVTDISAQIDQTAADQVERALANMTRQRFATISPQFAGVPKFAEGTNSAPGGMAWVGERGPELVNLPRGSQVFTAAQSAHMSGQSRPAPAPQLVGAGAVSGFANGNGPMIGTFNNYGSSNVVSDVSLAIRTERMS